MKQQALCPKLPHRVTEHLPTAEEPHSDSIPHGATVAFSDLRRHIVASPQRLRRSLFFSLRVSFLTYSEILFRKIKHPY